jgi:hypothetical protein
VYSRGAEGKGGIAECLGRRGEEQVGEVETTLPDRPVRAAVEACASCSRSNVCRLLWVWLGEGASEEVAFASHEVTLEESTFCLRQAR